MKTSPAPQNLWSRIRAAVETRRLNAREAKQAREAAARHEALVGEKRKLDGILAEQKTRLNEYHAQLRQVRAKNAQSRQRLLATLTRIGYPNPAEIFSGDGLNEEKVEALMRDLSHFEQVSAFDRAAEIVAAHGLQPGKAQAALRPKRPI